MTQFDGTTTDDTKTGGFHLLDPGNYIMKIESIQVRKTKNEDEMWAIKFMHSNGQNWVYDNVVWSEKAKGRVKQFLKCADMYKDGPQEYTPNLFIGKMLIVKVAVEKITYGKYKGRDGNCIPFDGYRTYEKEEAPGGATDSSDIPF